MTAMFKYCYFDMELIIGIGIFEEELVFLKGNWHGTNEYNNLVNMLLNVRFTDTEEKKKIRN